MQKLKAVFRSSSRKRARQSNEADPHHHPKTLPTQASHNNRRATSLDERGPRQSSNATKADTHHGRSRPLSSTHDSRQLSTAPGVQSTTVDHAQPQQPYEVNGSIASDYKAYLPALSPLHDAQDEQNTLRGNKQLLTGGSKGPNSDGVVNGNINDTRRSIDASERKPLPATPVLDVPGSRHLDRKQSVDSGISSVASTPIGQRPMRTFESGTKEPHSLPRSSEFSKKDKIVVDGHEDIEQEMEHMLDGVVDLRNTVDEDREVEWAPAVTHEIIKPHEHEIVQHQIFREIHNYEYYHRIQPVYDLQILPPRHWIPNPDGQGLIEVSADELPSRTGDNRRWKIVHEQVELPEEARPIWRTQPEIIEHPTTVTAEGFERKETTIIHPPTLQDMSEYDGLVQPVHFDHKTGKRWLGEITTMHQLRHELGQVSDPDLSLRELETSLPDVPGVSEVPELSQSPSLKRKPVTGPVPTLLVA